MSTRNVPPWYGVSDGPVFKRHGVYNRSWSDERTNAYTPKRGKKRPLSPLSLGKDLRTSNTLKERAKRERDDIRTRDGPAHVRQRVPDEFHRHSGGFVRGNFSQLFR